MKVSTVEEFMEVGEPQIQQIYAYKLRVDLYEGGPNESIDPDDTRVQVELRNKTIDEEQLLLLRFIFELTSHHWSGRVDYVIEYKLKKMFEIPDRVVAEFATRSAVMCVHPYVRSALADLTSKLPVQTVHLPLIQPGELDFASPMPPA